MANANRSETLADLLGVSGETIRWSHGLAFFIALLVSDLTAMFLEALLRRESVVAQVPLAYWLRLPIYNLMVTACILFAFRYQRRGAAAAALAATGYTAIMYPVDLLLQHLELTHLVFQRSPLMAAWNRFSWVFPLVIGLALALRWLRPVWLALGVGAAAGGLAQHVVWTATWALTRPERSIPFSISFRSELITALSGFLSAALFAFLFWLGVDMARTPKGRASKPFFLGSIGGGIALLVLVALSLAIPAPVSRTAALVFLVLAGLLTLYITVVWLILIHKMWAAIQDGHARTTPGKAVGLLFVPIFNFYWVFRAFWGFARDYNRYIDRHSLNVRKLPAWLFLVFTILSFLGGPHVMLITQKIASVYAVDIIVLLILVAKICDAVNALPESVAVVAPTTGAAAPSAAA